MALVLDILRTPRRLQTDAAVTEDVGGAQKTAGKATIQALAPAGRLSEARALEDEGVVTARPAGLPGEETALMAAGEGLAARVLKVGAGALEG